MKFLPVVVASLLIEIGMASAEPWLTPQWSYEFRPQALCLGSTWMEEGELNVAVGQVDAISIIQDGRLLTRIDSLEQNITTLVRLTNGDEPQLVTLLMKHDDFQNAFDYRVFSGDRYERDDTIHAGTFGGYWEMGAVDITGLWLDNSGLMNQDDARPKFAFPLDGTIQDGDHFWTEFGSGLFGPSRFECGRQSWIEKIDVDGASNYLILSHRWSYFSGDERPFPRWASSEVNLIRLSFEGDLISERTLSNAQSQGRAAIGYCRAFGGTFYEHEDRRSVLVAYCRIGNYYLQECDLPDLDNIRATSWSLDQTADLHVVQEDGIDYLLAFVPDGRVITFNLTDWEEVETSHLNDGGVLATRVGNFDDDPDWEVLQLRSTDLTLYNLHALSINVSISSLPSTLSLSAFPNPFNSSTTIYFSLPHPGRYAIDVIDIQGRLVSRLSGGWREAGSYREVFDAGATPGGAYVLRLNSSGQSREIPVILTK